MNGQCAANPQASNGTCLYGDDLVSYNDLVMTLPTPSITCNNAIQFLISNDYDPAFFCQSQSYTFSKTCCQTCAGSLIYEV